MRHDPCTELTCAHVPLGNTSAAEQLDITGTCSLVFVAAMNFARSDFQLYNLDHVT